MATLHERLLQNQAVALANSELIAAVLDMDPDAAEQLIQAAGGLHMLSQITASDRQSVPLNDTQRVRLLAVLELGRRLAAQPPKERPQVRTAADAAELVSDMRYLNQEHVRVILLDTARRVTHITTVYIGTLNVSVLRVAEIYRPAITHNSASLVIAHNHPSGDPTPSPQDVELTQTITAAGDLLDIPLVDHIIIGRDGWRSLRELGLLR